MNSTYVAIWAIESRTPLLACAADKVDEIVRAHMITPRMVLIVQWNSLDLRMGETVVTVIPVSLEAEGNSISGTHVDECARHVANQVNHAQRCRLANKGDNIGKTPIVRVCGP
jgi:hypothetical protein